MSLTRTVGLYTDPNCKWMEVTSEEHAQLPEHKPGEADFTDQLTGKKYRLRRGDCGFPDCLCSLLRLVDPISIGCRGGFEIVKEL